MLSVYFRSIYLLRLIPYVYRNGLRYVYSNHFLAILCLASIVRISQVSSKVPLLIIFAERPFAKRSVPLLTTKVVFLR